MFQLCQAAQLIQQRAGIEAAGIVRRPSQDDLHLRQICNWSDFCVLKTHQSLDWFKGKSTGNHGFYHQI